MLRVNALRTSVARAASSRVPAVWTAASWSSGSRMNVNNTPPHSHATSTTSGEPMLSPPRHGRGTAIIQASLRSGSRPWLDERLQRRRQFLRIGRVRRAERAEAVFAHHLAPLRPQQERDELLGGGLFRAAGNDGDRIDDRLAGEVAVLRVRHA